MNVRGPSVSAVGRRHAMMSLLTLHRVRAFSVACRWGPFCVASLCCPFCMCGMLVGSLLRGKPVGSPLRGMPVGPLLTLHPNSTATFLARSTPPLGLAHSHIICAPTSPAHSHVIWVPLFHKRTPPCHMGTTVPQKDTAMSYGHHC